MAVGESAFFDEPAPTAGEEIKSGNASGSASVAAAVSAAVGAAVGGAEAAAAGGMLGSSAFLAGAGASAAGAAVAAAAIIVITHLWHSRRRWGRRRRQLEAQDNSLQLCVDDADAAKSQKCIYLDYSATTPVHPLVVSAMMPYLSVHFGNPSSGHAYGQVPARAVRAARQSVIDFLQSGRNDEEIHDANSIIFTGCGTESNNLAIHLALQSSSSSSGSRRSPVSQANGTAASAARRAGNSNGTSRHTHLQHKKHIVTSNVEHPAILECLRGLEARGDIDVTYVPVDEEGVVPAEGMINAIQDGETVLVTLMYANNEVGSLQPVAQVARECRRRGILFHTDIAQAVGKVDCSLEEGLGDADMVTIVGHKVGAPKGIAALYVRPHCLTEHGRSEPHLYGKSGALLLGGGQEGGRRAGTENVPYIVGLGRALQLLMQDEGAGPKWKSNARHMNALRSRLLRNLQQLLGPENVRVNGPTDSTRRLPNTLSVGLRHVQASQLLSKLGMTVAASAGSACHSGGSTVSAVLQAMNVPLEFALGTIRFSVGPTSTESEMDRAAKLVAAEALQQTSLKLSRPK